MMIAATLCFLIVTAGLFIMTNTNPDDLTITLLNPVSRKAQRNQKIRYLTRKKPNRVQRMIDEAAMMLEASGQGEKLDIYKRMAVILAIFGFLFGLVIDNPLAGIVLGIGLMMAPLTMIRLRSADYSRMLNEMLETAMGAVTNNYRTTHDLLTAVGNVLPMLPSPVDDVFKRFYADMQYVDSNHIRAIERMRDSIDNWYWQEWCRMLIQCQDDKMLVHTLPSIVARLSSLRQVQIEIDTVIKRNMSDYILTVMVVLGSIPLMGWMMADWYVMLMTTTLGKITLAIVLGAILFTSVWVSRANIPLEVDS